MRVLLDTHSLLWWLSDDPALTKPARRVIADAANAVYVSAASAMEVATKVRLGKLPQADELAGDFVSRMEGERFLLLSVSVEHAVRAGLLPGAHRDPFDRILIAQAQAEDIPLISNESLFDSYAVRRIW